MYKMVSLLELAPWFSVSVVEITVDIHIFAVMEIVLPVIFLCNMELLILEVNYVETTSFKNFEQIFYCNYMWYFLSGDE